MAKTATRKPGVAIDMTGKKFGDFKVLERAGTHPQTHQATWRGVYPSGIEAIYSGYELRRGKINTEDPIKRNLNQLPKNLLRQVQAIQSAGQPTKPSSNGPARKRSATPAVSLSHGFAEIDNKLADLRGGVTGLIEHLQGIVAKIDETQQFIEQM